MLLMRACLLGALWITAAHAAPGGSACPTPFRVAFLDKPIPGMLAGEGAQFADPPGRFVDWLDQAMARLGCKAERVRVPQRRLMADTASDDTQVTFYLAHTPERAGQLVYPQRSDGAPDRRLALAETHLALFVRADRRDRVRWDGRTLLPAGLTVGIVGGGVEEPLAKAAGWTLDRALSHAGSIAKLRLGRVDVAVLPALSFSPDALSTPPALVALDPPLQRIAFFAPVSPALWAKHPQFVRRFWVAVCEAARDNPVSSGPSPTCQP
ncbi:hypothetical protein [Inhella crocodyli]|uniref:Transporter substrate-binding domain-containing protein n=1 Tax=Inhella crocodyli TaxID=2499851 RepID=A0A3S2V3N3_9BURK|nr:hypothetical protein [Inhella crocodyli]RVT87508.1 hypothetical protein EOD73_00300 [Inhella crocodyli]